MADMKKYLSTEGLSALVDQIKAEDAKVLAAAKSHAEGLGVNYDAAGTAATKVKELADGAVATNATGIAENKAAIAKLNGDVDTEGSVKKAVADSAATLNAAIEAVDAIADANAADIVTMKGQIDALEKGTYDDTEVRGLITANTGAIEALEGVHAEDKEALEDTIALKADQTALDAVSGVANAAVKQSDYDTKVAALEAEDSRIAGLVVDETAARISADEAMDARLVKVETFFETAEGETLDTALDTLVEIQKYVTSEGSAADQMVLDIAANAKAIEDEVKARGEADAALQEAIDLKADASALETLSGKVTGLETASATHATKDEVTAVSNALNEYKTAHTSDYTNSQIDEKIKVNADAIAALNDTYATDTELSTAIQNEVTRADGAYATKSLETTVAEHKADAVAHITAAERTAWNAAEQNAKDFAQGLVDAVSERVTDLEESSADYALDADLDAAVERIAANELAIAANTSAINSFTVISADEVNALFA